MTDETVNRSPVFKIIAGGLTSDSSAVENAEEVSSRVVNGVLQPAQRPRANYQPGNRAAARPAPNRTLRSPFRDRALIATAELRLTPDEIEQYAVSWHIAGESRNTPATLEEKKDVMRRFVWFLHHRGFCSVGTEEINLFLAYVKNGHLEPGGRWGNPRMTKPVRPIRVRGYFNVVRAFFRWLVRTGVLAVSPVEAVETPPQGADHTYVFSTDEIRALLAASEYSWHPRRDKAIVYFLYDTGVRASELCELKMRDLDLKQRRVRVHGKGDKYRTLGIGDTAFRALWDYLREEPRKPDSPVFMNDRGKRAGQHLHRVALLRLIHRLGDTAGIQTTRCSPHTFRHTFATEFLRGGGSDITLKDILGHSSLTMTQHYAHLADVDITLQQRQFSPGDRLGKG